MAETSAQLLVRLQNEVQELRTRLHSGSSAIKDLSRVSLIPKWAGPPKTTTLQEFFGVIVSTAHVDHWTNEDMVRFATFKLTDAARSFYNATPELHEPTITWDLFKAAFYTRFRDVRTDHFHFSQLQTARQRLDESVQQFAN
jgi:hypothetical protein